MNTVCWGFPRSWIRSSLLALALAVGLGTALAGSGTKPVRFSIEGAEFKLDGQPLVLRSGEMHYPRIPRAAWRDRLRMARAMGLNTVTTYVFWSQHEPEPGQWDFTGQNDLRAFIQTAAEEGLNVVIRPGPYVCAETDFGGFPAWLLRTPGLRVRSMDVRYLAATARYYQRLAQEIGDLQSSRGGPILMLQLENEYGSFGRDRQYLAAMKEQMQQAGFDAPLFTADGGSEALLDAGTLPEVPAVVNFGGDVDEAKASIAALARWRPGAPRMVGEYWAGWFDHWGEPHNRGSPSEAAQVVDWLLSQRVSFNLYMFHGGTSFGWLAGANYSAQEPYQPDTTSYDYDAALDEAGRPTDKFHALREVIARHAGEPLPLVPEAPRPQAIPPFTLEPLGSLLGQAALLSTPRPTRWVRPMEAFGQNHGYILYRKRLEVPAKGLLLVDEVRDMALVMADGRLIGQLDRRKRQNSLEVDLPAGTQLDVLVEAMGRIGFGARLVDEHKGITESIRIGNDVLEHWIVHPLALRPEDLQRLQSAPALAGQPEAGPMFWRGELNLSQPVDSFLDLRSWGKGQVWVNGHHLGRFWAIGPQQTLYLPASWLKPGRNEVLLLSSGAALGSSGATLQGVAEPIFEIHGSR